MQKLPLRRCPHVITFTQCLRHIHSSTLLHDDRRPYTPKRIQIRTLPLPPPHEPVFDHVGGFGQRSHSPQEHFMNSLGIQLIDAEKAANQSNWQTFREIFDTIFANVAKEEEAGRPVSLIDLSKIFTRYCMQHAKAFKSYGSSMPVTFVHLLITRTSNQMLDRLLVDVMQYMVSGAVPPDAHTLTLIFQRCASHRALDPGTAERALEETIALLHHIHQSLESSVEITPTLVKRWISFYSTVGDLTGALAIAQSFETHHEIKMDNDVYTLLLFACGRATSKDPSALQNAFHILQHLISTHNSKPHSSLDESFAIDSPLLDNLVFGLLTAPFGTPSDLNYATPEQITNALSALERIKVMHIQHHCPPPSVYVFQSIIFAMCKVGQVQQAFQLYKDMRRDYNYLLEDAQFVTLCSAVADAPNLGITEAVSLFMERVSAMKHRIGPDISPLTFSSFLDICVRADRLDFASLILKEMNEVNVPRDLTTYEILVRIYGKRGDVGRVLSLYHELLQQGLQPNNHFFVALISSLDGNLPLIYNLIQDMKVARVQPSEDLSRHVLMAVRQQEAVGAQWVIPLLVAVLNASFTPRDPSQSSTPLLTSSTSHVPTSVTPESPVSNPPAVSLPAEQPFLSGRTWNEFMEVIAKSPSQPSDMVLQLLTLMKSHTSPVSRVMYRDLILGRVAENDVDAVKQLLTLMITDNTTLDIDLVTSIARTAANNSPTNVLPYQRAIENVIELSSSDKSEAYSILFKGLCRAGQTDLALSLLDEMVNKSMTTLQASNLADLISSVSAADFVRQSVKIYDRFASYGYTPDSALVLQMAEKCHSSSDVALVLATKQSSNLSVSSLVYEQLLLACLKQSPVDMPLFENVMHSMTQEKAKISVSALENLFATCKWNKLLDPAQRLWAYVVLHDRQQFSFIVSCAQTAAKCRSDPASQTFARTLLAAGFRLDEKGTAQNWPALLAAVIQTYNGRTGAQNAILEVLRDCGSRHEGQLARYLAHDQVSSVLAEALQTRLCEPLTVADWRVINDCIRRMPCSVQKMMFDHILGLSETNSQSKNSKAPSLHYNACVVAIKVFGKFSTWPESSKQELVPDVQQFRRSFFKLLSGGAVGTNGKPVRVSTLLQNNGVKFSPADWAELCIAALKRQTHSLVNDIFAQPVDWKSVPQYQIKQLLGAVTNAQVNNKPRYPHMISTLQSLITGKQ